MTVRLITVPLEDAGGLGCKDCHFKVEDGDDEDWDEGDCDSDGESPWWCAAFRKWISYDDRDQPERLDICVEST